MYLPLITPLQTSILSSLLRLQIHLSRPFCHSCLSCSLSLALANIQAFYAPLLDILDDKALTVIFANIEDLLLTATSFLSELEQRQKACRLYIDVIGDILEEHMGRMRVYMVSLEAVRPIEPLAV